MIITSTIELSYLSYKMIITHLKQLFNTLKQEITTLVENHIAAEANYTSATIMNLYLVSFQIYNKFVHQI